MLKFYLAICRNMFYVYRGGSREAETFDGNAYFEYEPRKTGTAAKELVRKILDNNNLVDAGEIQFVLIENSDTVTNDIVAKNLGTAIERRYRLGELIYRAVMELAKNPQNYIVELGANYDGECYYLENGQLWRGEYSLLALALEPKDLLNFVA